MERYAECSDYSPWGDTNDCCLYYSRKMKACLSDKHPDNKCEWLGRPFNDGWEHG